MNAFIAWTPLHLINIINTAINYYEDEVNDLYIYNEFDRAYDLYEVVKKTKVFRDVYLVDHRRIINSKMKLINLVLNRNSFDIKLPVYERIFLEGDNYFAKIIYAHSKKSNPSLELNYIEDGIGAYVGSKILDRDAKKNQLISLINKYSIYKEDIKQYFLYEPNLVQTDKDEEYRQLPKLDVHNKALPFIKKIFDISDTKVNTDYQEIYIFLDQPFQQDGSSVDEVELFNLVKTGLEKDQKLVVKLHPRSKPDKYGNVELLNTNLPWEAYCLTTNIDKLKVISMASTASFTPMLMFNTNTHIIYLAEWINNYYGESKLGHESYQWFKHATKFAEALNQSISSNIVIPSNLDEFKAAIKE